MDILYALHRIDLRLFHRIFQQGERGILRPLARALSRSADGYLIVLLPVLLFALEARRAETFAILLLVSLTLERALYWLLKNSLKRRRTRGLTSPGFTGTDTG